MRNLTTTILIVLVTISVANVAVGQENSMSSQSSATSSEELVEPTRFIEYLQSTWSAIQGAYSVGQRITGIIESIISAVFTFFNTTFEEITGISFIGLIKGLWKLILWLVSLVTGLLDSLLGAVEGLAS